MMAAPIPIERALEDRRLLGARFGDATSWRTWFAVLKAAYGRPLTKSERAAFDRVAGGRKPPTHKVRELIVVASRRAGKGSVAGAVAAYEAALVHHELAPGERGVVACVSATTAQAAIVREYCGGVFQASPILARELVDTTVDELRLRNGTVVTTLAADYRSLRGRTLLAAILDEAAFLENDLECARALLPGLATTGGMLLVLSSPYRRSGLVFERHRDYFGRDDDDVLVVAGPSELFNPTLDKAMLAKARAADPEGARAEWGGEFRSDTGALFDDATIEAAIDRGRPLELPPRSGIRYAAFCDAAGGAAGDAYTLAIGHKEGEALIIDVVRGAVGKFDPDKTTADYAALLREYGISSVVGDHFAAGWVEGAWRANGITYRASEPNRSQIYIDAVPLFARGVASLPDHPRLLRELRQLERRVARNGRETVDHPRGASDDFANAACGVLLIANASAAALWRRTDLLPTGDAILVPPRYADALFAVVIAGERGDLGAVFFSYRATATPPVLILDYAASRVDPAALHSIIDKLWRFVESVPATTAMIFTQAALADEFVRLGYRKGIERVDDIAKDAMLPVAIAPHIGAGRVKLSSQARARTETTPLGLLDGTTADADDPLRVAALLGVAVALDRGRSLTRRAA